MVPVRKVLLDLATRRQRSEDPTESVFAYPYREASKFFPQVVERAQAILRTLGRDPSRLEGFTWHGLRHTFASRLVMSGADLRTVQELGGWRTLSMGCGTRISPRIICWPLSSGLSRRGVTRGKSAVELGLNLDFSLSSEGVKIGNASQVVEKTSRRGGRARLKASDSKSDRGASPSGVQILSPPPFILNMAKPC